jgi:hypothetical protein
VDDRRRCDDPAIGTPEGLDARHEWLNVREFWDFMKENVSHFHSMSSILQFTKALLAKYPKHVILYQ